MTETDVVEWLYGLVVAGLPADADMGRIEKAVETASLEIRRQVVERLVQQAADRCAAKCPGCGGRLSRHVRGRKRRVATRCGQICFRRDYGRCPSCGRYSYPADVALGLHERATASPLVQEICALETLNGPAGCKAAASNSPASSGPWRVTRPSSHSTPSTATKGGTCSSRTTATEHAYINPPAHPSLSNRGAHRHAFLAPFP